MEIDAKLCAILDREHILRNDALADYYYSNIIIDSCRELGITLNLIKDTLKDDYFNRYTINTANPFTSLEKAVSGTTNKDNRDIVNIKTELMNLWVSQLKNIEKRVTLLTKNYL